MTETEIDVRSIIDRLSEQSVRPVCQTTPCFYPAVKRAFELRENNTIHEALMPAVMMTTIHLTRITQDADWMRDLRAINAIMVTLARDDIFIHAIVPRDFVADKREQWKASMAERAKALSLDTLEMARAWIIASSSEFFAKNPMALVPMLVGGMDEYEINGILNNQDLFCMSCVAAAISGTEQSVIQYQGMEENASPGNLLGMRMAGNA